MPTDRRSPRGLRTVGIASIAFVSLIAAEPSSAEIKTITATGEYRMGDNDTRTDAKRLALLDAKRLALEQAGTYLESVTEIKNLQVSRDELNAYTAGIVEVTELGTKDILEGATHVICVEVTAKIDTAEVLQQVNTLRRNERAKAELLRLRAEGDRFRQELEQKTKELASLKSAEKTDTIVRQRQQLLIHAFVNELVDRAFAAYSNDFMDTFLDESMRAMKERKSRYTRSAINALAKARSLAEQALSLDPANSDAQAVMAHILTSEGGYYVEIKKYDEATKRFQAALQLAPNNAHLRNQHAHALIKMGNAQMALDEAREAIKLDPREPMYHATAGDAFYRKGDAKNSEAEYRNAIRLDPEGGLYYIGLAFALTKQGRGSEAKIECNKVMALVAAKALNPPNRDELMELCNKFDK